MRKSISTFLVILVSTFILNSCEETTTNNYYQEPGDSPPDVNVVYSSYVLKTIHSFHMDTTAYPEYNYVIDLYLKLDKPENRSQINKMIIVSEEGTGWEFFQDELEVFFSSTMEGYELKNLIFRSSNQNLDLYTVKLFSSTNGTAQDYQFILIPYFIYPHNINHGWYTQTTYQIDLGYGFNPSDSTKGEIYWLDQNKGSLSSESFSSSDLVEYRYLRFSNVPQQAYFFYISYQQEIENGVSVSFLSAPFAIEERYPENIQLLNENIYNFDIVKYVADIQKILIADRSNNYLFIIDFNTFELNSKVTFSSSIYSLAYSGYDGKIYVGCYNGQLYSLSVSNPSPTFVTNLNAYYIYGMVVANKFLIVNTGNEYRILNLEYNSVIVENSQYYHESKCLVYNNTKEVVYGLSNYGDELSRFNFDPVTGAFSNYSYRYISGSSTNGDELLLYPDDSKIAAPNGYVYNCSSINQNDLIVYGNMGQSFISASFSEDGNGIITLYRSDYGSYSRIKVFDKNNLSGIGSVEEFFNVPEYLVSDGQTIKVLSRYYNNYYYITIAELFNYSEIISGLEKIRSPIIKERFYLSRKIIY